MSSAKGFVSGVVHLLRGFSFLASHLRLWPWALLPTIINLLLLAIMLGAFVHYYGDIYGWLSAHIGRFEISNPTTWYWHILSGVLWFLNILFGLLIVLMSLIILLLISYALGIIIASPFNDALSERVETIAVGTVPPPFALGKFIKDIFRIVKIESLKGLIFIAIPAFLFIFNFIPGVGGVLYVTLTFIFGAWSLGFAYADLPMGRRVAPLSKRLAFARENFWSLAGLGCGFAIPFFGLVFAAPMAVGGTLLYIDISHGKISHFSNRRIYTDFVTLPAPGP